MIRVDIKPRQDDRYDIYVSDDNGNALLNSNQGYGGGPSGWVGFDCLHSGDVWPDGPSWDRGKPWSKNWTAALVAEETRRLARNIAAADYATAELSGAAAHVADDEWPVGEVQG